MSPVTHFLTGWVLANTADLGRRDRVIVTFAAVVPDVDGLGIIPELFTRHSQHPLLWFSQYHHALHTLLFALFVSLFAFFISNRRWLSASLSLVAFHLHLLEDLVGSRGPDGFNWPIPYLYPLSHRWVWTWEGQWALNAWPNIVLTVGLLGVTLWLAVRRGFSPVDIFSPVADRSVISALRKWFHATGATA
jgi:inner membrane protein